MLTLTCCLHPDPVWPLANKRVRGVRSKPESVAQPCDVPASTHASVSATNTPSSLWGSGRFNVDDDPDWEPGRGAEGGGHAEVRPKKRGRPPGRPGQPPKPTAPRSGPPLLQRICQMSEDSSSSKCGLHLSEKHQHGLARMSELFGSAGMACQYAGRCSVDMEELSGRACMKVGMLPVRWPVGTLLLAKVRGWKVQWPGAVWRAPLCLRKDVDQLLETFKPGQHMQANKSCLSRIKAMHVLPIMPARPVHGSKHLRA